MIDSSFSRLVLTHLSQQKNVITIDFQKKLSDHFRMIITKEQYN